MRNRLQEAVGDVVVVGHLPFLSKLAALLVTNDERCAIAAFRYSCVLCVERGEAGGWKIVWMITPNLLED